MIAIDTNVLLRYLLQDDPGQAKKATDLITGNAVVLVSDVVLAETVWTLKGKKYQLAKSGLASVILSLLKEKNFCFEDSQVIWQALCDYRKADASNGKEAGFVDALIARKATYIARAKGLELDGVYTFDAAAQKLPGMLVVV